MKEIRASAFVRSRRIREYIENKGWKYVGLYGESEAEIVVFPSISYAVKKIDNLSGFISKIFNSGIEIAFAKEDINSIEDRSTFLLRVLEAISTKPGDKIKKGMQNRIEKGRPVYPAPYGYKYSGGRLVLNRREFWHVKKIFSLYLMGKTTKEIAEFLNGRGVPTRSGKPWKKQTVWKILTNPIYCGYLKWKGRLIRGEHKPIISEKEYEEVQSRLKGSSYKPVVNEGFGFQSL